MLKHKIWITLSLLIILGTACQANRPPANEASPPHQPDREQRVQQMSQQPNKERNANENPQEVAERLVKLAVKVPEVHDATAVVIGNYAVVGIDVDMTLDRSRVGTIKYAVAQALREDPKGANAVVTSDPDIVQRLREMAEDIRNGRPIAGFAEELSDIVARIIPQFPNTVEKKEQPQTETNLERLNQQNR